MGSKFGVAEFTTHFRTYGGDLGCSLFDPWPFERLGGIQLHPQSLHFAALQDSWHAGRLARNSQVGGGPEVRRCAAGRRKNAKKMPVGESLRKE